jgi:hypothetical protein
MSATPTRPAPPTPNPYTRHSQPPLTAGLDKPFPFIERVEAGVSGRPRTAPNPHNACEPAPNPGLSCVLGEIRPKRMEAPKTAGAHIRFGRSRRATTLQPVLQRDGACLREGVARRPRRAGDMGTDEPGPAKADTGRRPAPSAGKAGG